MVRGVNRTIIEINCTENSYFDRILLFVDPECPLSAGQLEKKAREYAKSVENTAPPAAKRMLGRPAFWKIAALIAAAAVVTGVTVLLALGIL